MTTIILQIKNTHQISWRMHMLFAQHHNNQYVGYESDSQDDRHDVTVNWYGKFRRTIPKLNKIITVVPLLFLPANFNIILRFRASFLAEPLTIFIEWHINLVDQWVVCKIKTF